jgi:uncharacterized membrane protein YdjX (TVP38/TMEM64 family)
MSTLGNTRGWLTLVLLTLFLGMAAVTGRDLANHIGDVEDWIRSHGWIGRAAFIGMVILFTSLFIPDTLLAVIAGALFGLLWGTVMITIGALCTAALIFVVSHVFLRDTVCNMLSRRPKLAAIHEAVSSEGLKFQLLLRLSPLNPVVVHYVLGASRTRFSTFMLACLGMIPTLAVEVYFGHAARHVAAAVGSRGEHSGVHTVLTLAGLAIAIAVLVYITRIARQTLSAYESPPTPPGAGVVSAGNEVFPPGHD